MSQNDLEIANQTFPNTRADINNALQALGSTNSGPTAPTTPYANMQWYDTANNTLKQRTEDNDDWILLAYLDQSSKKLEIFEETRVVDSSGVSIATLGIHSNAVWKTGTEDSNRLISPDKLKAVLDDFGTDLGSDLIDINGFSNDNYMEIGSGSTKLLVQWMRGTVTVDEDVGEVIVPWPKNFSNVFNVQVSLEKDLGAGMDAGIYIRQYSNTSCRFSISAPNDSNYGSGKYHIIGIGI
jgi:hypothetical protein